MPKSARRPGFLEKPLFVVRVALNARSTVAWSSEMFPNVGHGSGMTRVDGARLGAGMMRMGASPTSSAKQLLTKVAVMIVTSPGQIEFMSLPLSPFTFHVLSVL